MLKYLKSITIETIKARCRTKPHKALRIFIYAVDMVVRQSITYIELRKLILAALRKSVNTQKKYYSKENIEFYTH